MQLLAALGVHAVKTRCAPSVLTSTRTSLGGHAAQTSHSASQATVEAARRFIELSAQIEHGAAPLANDDRGAAPL
jgi:hypothetical protein